MLLAQVEPLPLCPQKPSRQLKENVAHNDSDAAHQDEGHGSIAVLLVDDQRFIGIAVGRLLAEERDMHLHCCYSAIDAVAQANLLAPAVIFQDLLMPDVDGLTLVGRYRGNPATAATPVIVLSGNDDPSSRASAMAAGADDYLVKLPKRDALVACIRRHAAGRAGVSTFAGSPQPSATTDVTLDRSVLDALRESAGANGAPFVATLIEQFLAEASLLANRLTQSSDVAVLKITAHSLKGAALTIGAQRLGMLAGQVEDHTDRHPAVSVDAALFSAIAEELGRVRADCLFETKRL